MVTLLISALMLGLAGSFHCAGMCGPIVLALPLHGHTLKRKVYGALFYNLGRVVTYAIMGLVFGMIGQGLELMGFQQVVSIVMGAGMIIVALFPKFFRSFYDNRSHGFGWTGTMKNNFRKLFAVRSYLSLFFIGLFNGLLPCGLVYIALAGALAAGNVINGTLYMTIFGMGTIPMLLVIATMGNVVSVSLRHKINKLIPTLVIIVGIFFILRGLSLGIPYLSPKKEKIDQKFEKRLEEKGLSSTISENIFQF